MAEQEQEQRRHLQKVDEIIQAELLRVNPEANDPEYLNKLKEAEDFRKKMTIPLYNKYLGVHRPAMAYHIAVGCFADPEGFEREIRQYVNEEVAAAGRMKRSRSGSGSFKSTKKQQLGGTYKPAEYHGTDSGRYTASPSGAATGAYGPQVAVSQGVIHGDVAGPNLAWSGGNMMTGGGSNSKQMKQLGGTYKPAEYHGSDSGRYTASPSGAATGAYGPQVAVSQGVIHGDVAGPNLAWSGGNMMTGGAKHRRRRNKKSTLKKQKTPKKH